MTIEQTKAAAVEAVRAFADFYKANAARIDALPNAEEMHGIRLELLALIKRVSDEVEAVAALPAVKQAAKAAQVAQDVAVMIETLRSRRAELEHWLGKTSGKSVLVLLGLLALGGVGVWYAKKNGMLGGLAEEDCGCGG